VSLLDIVRREIEQTGPMPISRYMALCLGHPDHGYYMTRDPLGGCGDFTTAPEISQMFGEMVGAWLVVVWQSMGRTDCRLVELGPGRGTLMADARRVAARAGFAPDIWLIETSSALRALQRRRVPDANWAETLAEVPEGPIILVANEFFDALPVRQYLTEPGSAREIVIALDAGGSLSMGLTAPFPMEGALPGWDQFASAAGAVAGEIGERLGACSGAALIVDYGFGAADRPPGPTLQAVRGHEKVDVLASPGDVDLSALVDFDRLARQLAPAETWRTTQGSFLTSLGIGHRAAALADARPEAADEIADALERLTSPAAMGTLFKVLAAASPGIGPLPGFEEIA